MARSKFQRAKRNNNIRVARGLAPPVPSRAGRPILRIAAPIAAVARAASRPRPRRPPIQQGSLGNRIGSMIGGGAQKLFKMITGFGDYKVENNSLMEGGLSPPQVVNSVASGGFIVRHREYLDDIVATTAFTNIAYNINPGIAFNFPWLASIAAQFEEYVIRGMVFEYKTMSSDVILSSNTTTALGTVIMATQYNSINPTFPDKKTMENYEFACSSKPSLSFIHPIECKPGLVSNPHLYIRTGVQPTGSDLRLYDLGIFQIATQGMQNNGGVIGELWCSYEIELFKPKVSAGDLGDNINTAHFYLNSPSAAAPLGTSQTTRAGSTLNVTIASNVVSWPLGDDGTYQITYSIYGSVAGVIVAPGEGFTNIKSGTGSGLPYTWNSSNSGAGTSAYYGSPGNTVSSQNYMYSRVVQCVPSTNGTLSTYTLLTAGTLPSGTTAGDLLITQLVNGIN